MHRPEAVVSKDQLQRIMVEVLCRQGMLSEAERDRILQCLCCSGEKKPSGMQSAYEDRN